MITTERESVLITGFVTVRQARPEEKSALITHENLSRGCTLFCFGLLFLLNFFVEYKKDRFQSQWILVVAAAVQLERGEDKKGVFSIKGWTRSSIF
jgi:hypothetical protein